MVSLIRRVLSFGFFALVIFAVWYQKRMMRVWSKEFDADLEHNKPITDLMRLNSFVAHEYRNGRHSRAMRANESVLDTEGNLLILGDVRIEDLASDKSQTKVIVESTEARAKIDMPQKPKDSLFETLRNFEIVRLPSDVVVKFDEDEVFTKNVTLDVKSRWLTSNNEVILKGKGKNSRGNGFKYNLDSGVFEMGGPIEGLFLPDIMRKGE